MFRKLNTIKDLRWSVREFMRSFYKCEIFDDRLTHTKRLFCLIKMMTINIIYIFLTDKVTLVYFIFKRAGDCLSFSESFKFTILLEKNLINFIFFTHVNLFLNESTNCLTSSGRKGDLIEDKLNRNTWALVKVKMEKPKLKQQRLNKVFVRLFFFWSFYYSFRLDQGQLFVRNIISESVKYFIKYSPFN